MRRWPPQWRVESGLGRARLALIEKGCLRLRARRRVPVQAGMVVALSLLGISAQETSQARSSK